MIRSRYRWEYRQADETLALDWSRRLGIPPLAAKVLLSRGIGEEEAASFFRDADEGGLIDPFLMKGMAAAAERIRRAVRDGERIRVYGDYDADGVSSTALMIRLLTMLEAVFDTYIPHRSLEGYGMNTGAIDLAADAGVSLIVTVDNGISAVEQIAYARERGIDVVVTDHHEPPAVLPEAVALVNPKQPDCPYPFKGLCGAGVAFKLAHALLGRPAIELSDLAAIGTVADLMPLAGENRLIVRMGLARMRRDPSEGVRALAAVCGTGTDALTSGRIGFGLAPRLNAGGRLERADGAVRLLTTDSREEAESLAKDLDRLNLERQKLVEATVEEADRLWRQRMESAGGFGPNVIVLAGEGWNAGIAGLVASKLVERYYRPAIVLAADPETGKCKGSARSIDGFDLYAALTECADCLEHYGGHQAAAGMTLLTSRTEELERLLHRIAEERLLPEDWLPKKKADLACAVGEATLAAAEALARLEPFGNGNPTPRLMFKGVAVKEARTMGKEDKHLRLTVEQDGQSLEAVGFGLGGHADRLPVGRELDLLGELAVNEWNGSRRVQLTIQDLKSEQAVWIDRRKDSNPWAALERLSATDSEKLLVVCATPVLATEANGRLAGRGVKVCRYPDLGERAKYASRETAAARENGAASHDSADGNTLVLLGLPDTEADIAFLGECLKDEKGWESVYLFGAGSGRRDAPLFLDRKDFSRVYAVFREQGAWIDGPESFARKAAERVGLSLAAVRLVQEVFEELGFIRVSGAERSMVSSPSHRKLEESERYARMVRAADAASFPDWPLERLRSWAKERMSPGG